MKELSDHLNWFIAGLMFALGILVVVTVNSALRDNGAKAEFMAECLQY